jgi:hypothetical protein
LPLLPCEHGSCPGGDPGGPAAKTDAPPLSTPSASTSGAANQMNFFIVNPFIVR